MYTNTTPPPPPPPQIRLYITFLSLLLILLNNLSGGSHYPAGVSNNHCLLTLLFTQLYLEDEIGTVKMDRPCYQNYLWTFTKEIPLLRTTSGKCSHGCQISHVKASLKDFNIARESWEQIVQDRTKWRGLIRRGAGEYEAKRIREAEAEQKRAAESQS